MATPEAERLRQVQTFPQLVKYLRDELDWPLEKESVEELTFDWNALELGVDVKNAAKIEDIKQLRPLGDEQPWGIFFVKFAPKRLPVVALRRILGQLALKKRASSMKADRRAWSANDLLFISAFGEGSERKLTFAHFSVPEVERDLPTLRVLGWDGDDTALKLDHVARVLREKLTWPDSSEDTEKWRSRWSAAFALRPRQVIRTSKELAVRLADLAKVIRKRVEQLLALESERGSLRKLYAAFREALIHDLTENDFADMYAQTIAYGLFSAAVTEESIGDRHKLIADDMASGVPITNPFLRELLGSFLSVGGRKREVDFDELGVQEVVETLRSPETHLADVLRDFGNRTRDDDPVIHFYESFLKEYDRQRKVERGVFYTPRPVVSYIVRSVDDLLRSEFGLEDGLASTVTWREMAKRHKGITVPLGMEPDGPFVTVLDPATGTATFLVEVIDVIYGALMERWKREGAIERVRQERWNSYVPDHLLPRLYGFELMMAPYAIAHMKIGLKLLETGYKFTRSERARVYLTNALEPARDYSNHFAFDVPALAHEALAVNHIKRTHRFCVVVGNPPYANFGRLNRNEFILGLLDDYKRGLDEKKLNLDDDYIKFVRFAQWLLSTSGVGILAMITNSSFVDGLVHREMRRQLLEQFPIRSILDLRGNSRRRDVTGKGTQDQNVFDIQQGVAIGLWAQPPQVLPKPLKFAALCGTRSEKYDKLSAFSAADIAWEEVSPIPPNYFFVAQNRQLQQEYEAFVPFREVFSVIGSGLNTDRDELCIDFEERPLGPAHK